MKLNVRLADNDQQLKVSLQDSSETLSVQMRNLQTITQAVDVNDYDALTNKPSINEHKLSGGENSLSELGIGLASITDIDKLFR